MLNISPVALSKLRCTLCSGYLSYFPIYTNLSDGSLRCGRCDNSSENLSRNEIFESLVGNTIFPCNNNTQGCKLFLIPSTMKNHENDYCAFKQFNCIKSDCKYTGFWDDLEDHLINEHNIHYLFETKENNSFGISLETPREINVAVKNFDKYFYVNMQIEYHQIFVKVSAATATNDDDDLKLKFIVKFYNEYNPQFEKLECTLNQTNIINIWYYRWDKRSFKKYIVVEVEKDEITSEPREVKPELEDLNYEILDHIKCSKCDNYIVPPIFQCITGHGICSNCKMLIKTCPLSDCKSRIDNTRNYSLERLLRNFNFSYPHQNNGCMFVDRVEETEKHVKTCSVVLQVCPSRKCKWTNSKWKLPLHLKETHTVMPNSHLQKFFVSSNGSLLRERFVITRCNNLFKFVYTQQDFIHYWSVQYLGDQEKCRSYSFMIDFVDLSETNQKLKMRQFCSPLIKEQSKWFEGRNYVSVNHFALLRVMGKNPNCTDKIQVNSDIAFYVHINKL